MLSCVRYKGLQVFLPGKRCQFLRKVQRGSLVAATRTITKAPIHVDTGNNAVLNVALNLKLRNTVIAAREYTLKEKLHH